MLHRSLSRPYEAGEYGFIGVAERLRSRVILTVFGLKKKKRLKKGSEVDIFMVTFFSGIEKKWPRCARSGGPEWHHPEKGGPTTVWGDRAGS